MNLNAKIINMSDSKKVYNPLVLLDRWVYSNYRNTKIGELVGILFDKLWHTTNGVKNIVRWIPTIYNDTNWDYSSIYVVLHKKIELLRKTIVTNNRHSDVNYQNTWMTITLNLIAKVKEEEYSTEYFDYIEKDFTFDKVDDSEYEGEKLYQMNSTVISDRTLDYVNKNKSKVRILKKLHSDFDGQSNEDKSRMIASYKHEQAKKLLFKILETKIEYWWD